MLRGALKHTAVHLNHITCFFVYTWRLRPEVQPHPLPFYIPFFTKKVPLSYTLCWQMVPLLHNLFRTLLCIPVNALSYHKNRTFSRLFRAIKFIC